MSEVPAAATIALRLAQGERIAASELSRRTKMTFEPLLVSGLIKVDGNRRGEAYMAVHPPQLRDWVMRMFPKASGLWAASTSGAQNILYNRGTKARRRGNRTLGLLFRALAEANFTLNGRAVPLKELTDNWGAAAVALRPHDAAILDNDCALVENPELFWAASPQCGVTQPLVLFKDGRASERLLTWLSSCHHARFVLHVDFDPVGLDEYRRMRETLGERLTLYLPPDLAGLFRQFGDQRILSRKSNVALLKTLRALEDSVIQSVVALIDQHACALEQEALLVGRAMYGGAGMLPGASEL
jgi:hypothetical protein